MSITEKSLRKVDDSANISLSKLLLYPRRDQMYLEVNEPLVQGQNYSLFLKFSYTLKETLEGFYLSHYVTPSGAKRYLATTQFEPNAARAAFPCLDEPQLKASFRLSMVRHQEHTALFNTPLRHTEDLGFYLGAGIKRDDFYPSVRMSTYLVAFIVSDYTHISATADNDVVVSVWAPPHLVQQGQFAREVAVSCLNFYGDYFGIPFQLPKIDLVAVPDFGGGAMENWGLVTFRDTSLLYDSTQSSSALKEWVTVVVAHELAHQWFGNLVTMEWWNDLWLNEGFATLMEYIGAGNAKPDFHMSQQFILKTTLTALTLDSLRNSHPISVPVTDPEEIESIFDVISYSKGAALLYMLMKEIGQTVFKAGLHRYLNRHMFGNTRTDDLWAAIQEASQEISPSDPAAGSQVTDIKAMMDSWTLQKGYPLIQARLEDGRLTLRQTPFVMLSNGSESAGAAPTRWHVPVRCRLHRLDGVLSVRLDMVESVSVEVQSEPAWYYCNVNKTGVYRVMYPAENWAALEGLLLDGSGHLSVEDRGALIDDAFSLNRAAQLNGTVPLRLSTSLLTERGLAPWSVAERHLRHWLHLVFDLTTHAQLQAFARRLLLPRYTELGWSDTGSHLVRQQRTLILAWAVSVRLPEAVARARTLFNDWKAGLQVPPDFRALVYATGVEYGNESDWQFVWGRYLNASTPSEKKALLMALGASQDPLTIENLLRRSLAGDKVRTQDFASVVESVAANEAGRLRLWRFVRLHWPEIMQKVGVGTFMMDNVIQEMVSRFTTQLELDEVRTFFAGKELRSAERSLQQAIESIELNVRWRRRYRADVHRWLHEWNQRQGAAAA
ncbi:endoplasmic reticulum aminopeptidase 1-like [Pollicipes pollicipes]|uniref:endoplasmic reticulum aminopeptidase 1-like n=1 Tax=Pollicipes pollicipes TaxID=41117 RepID=UPI001884BE80|nr:endoplasmic reticulum aminopeptidase 1-like [Pollicipes pollicipes]